MMFSKQIKVEKIMFAHPRCIDQSATLSEINELFKINDFHHLLVINNDGKLAGIISQEDFKYALEQIVRQSSGKTYTEQILDHWTAERIMTQNPTFVQPEDSVQLVADYFLGNEFHALPVLDNENEIVGIITSHDLLKYAYQ